MIWLHGGNAWKHSSCCEPTQGPSTSQNRSLRERFWSLGMTE